MREQVASLISQISQSENQVWRYLILNIEGVVIICDCFRIALESRKHQVAGCRKILWGKCGDCRRIRRVSEDRVKVSRCLVKNSRAAATRVGRVREIAVKERLR